MTKTVSILGATGSVGRSTAGVILAQPHLYDVQAVTACTNAAVLAAQAKALNAKLAVVSDASAYSELKEALAGTGIEAAAGEDALMDAAARPADWIMDAIVGVAGLKPLMAAIAQGRCVAIANKEPLVAAGPLVMEAARKSGATILPVDSEHNALFQVFEDRNRAAVTRLILTASGGPFRTHSLADMAKASPAAALAHPNWVMGQKVSIDSATMMNKALEVIEARWLFDMPAEKIDVLVHPQSVIHSMVEYSDGSVLAQMGASDMHTPIAHALGWPQRINSPGQKLDFAQIGKLTFEPVDAERFPSVGLAYECLRSGLASCVALNAANEVAVGAFLRREAGFLGIYDTVRSCLDSIPMPALATLEDVFMFDQNVRARAGSIMMVRDSQTRAAS